MNKLAIGCVGFLAVGVVGAAGASYTTRLSSTTRR
jgi:hypothetical protein